MTVMMMMVPLCGYEDEYDYDGDYDIIYHDTDHFWGQSSYLSKLMACVNNDDDDDDGAFL